MVNRKQVTNPVFEALKEYPLEYESFNSRRWIENEKIRVLESAESLFYNHRFLKKMVVENDHTKILDFGGSLATSLPILKEVFKDTKFTYTVVETKEICQAGIEMTLDNRVFFVEEILSVPKEDVEVVYIRTALQYAKDWKKTLEALYSLQPSLVILEHLTAGKINTFQGVQNYYGRKVPYWFLGVDDLSKHASQWGYEITMQESCEDLADSMYDESIKKENRVHQTVRIVMKGIQDD